MNNTNEPEIDVPEENLNAGLPIVAAKVQPVEKPADKPMVTAAQAKVEAIADLTHSAYQKAATLQITKEESEALIADFPDDAFKPGAGGNANLLYLEHAFLRDRFTKVFGMGQWAIIPRRTWNESFTTQRGTPGERVYVEAMLVVRGCFVGEAVGSMEYYPKNENQNYGDAVEGAKTAAFRRCAKEFGVGLQAWKKDWCDGWWARKASTGKSLLNRTPKPIGRDPVPLKDDPPPEEQAKLRAWFEKEIGGDKDNAVQYVIELGWILPTEGLDSIRIDRLPKGPKGMEMFRAGMKKFFETGKAENPFGLNWSSASKPIEVPRDPNPDCNSPDAPWRSFPFPHGKNAGIPLAQMDKGQLWYWWNTFKAEPTFKTKEGTVKKLKAETYAKNLELRAMLDEAGKHYEFTSDGFEEEG